MTQPAAAAAALSLRAVGSPEMDFAYRFAIAAQTGWPRLYLRGAVQASTFSSMLWAGVESLFLVSHPDAIDGGPRAVPLGFVGIYDLAQRHRTAKVEVVLAPDAAPGAIDDAATTIVDYAINAFDLRVVYCEHIGDTCSPFAGIDVAIEEGRFVDYVYHRDPDDGEAAVAYWDLVTTSVSADRWRAR